MPENKAVADVSAKATFRKVAVKIMAHAHDEAVRKLKATLDDLMKAEADRMAALKSIREGIDGLLSGDGEISKVIESIADAAIKLGDPVPVPKGKEAPEPPPRAAVIKFERDKTGRITEAIACDSNGKPI